MWGREGSLALVETRGEGPRRSPGRAPRVCLECGERPARYCYHGRVRADRTHTLCFECYRAYLNRCREAARGTGAGVSADLPRRARDVVDRDALMTELARRRRQAILAARRVVEWRSVPALTPRGAEAVQVGSPEFRDSNSESRIPNPGRLPTPRTATGPAS